MSRKSLVTFIVCVSSCTQLSPNNNQISSSKKTNASAEEFLQEDTSENTTQAQAGSSILYASPKGGFKISEELGVSEDTYTFRFNESKPVLNVLKLTNPPRLVIDIASSKNAASEEIRTSDISNITGIRLGSHSDKMRVVLDLKSEQSLSKQNVQSTGNDILVSIPVSEDAKPQRLALLSRNLSARARLDSESQDSEQAPVVESLPDSEKKGSETAALVEENEPAADVDQESAVAADTSSGEILLKSVQFAKAVNSGGEVTLDLTTPVAFELIQTAQSEYVLSLPGVVPEESTLAPQIASKGADGIRSVRVVEENGKTLVRFFVDSGTNLSAIPRDEQIVIKPSTGLASKSGKSRAQLGDGKQTVDEKTAQANPTGFRSADGSKTYTGRLISLDLQDTDIDNALRIIAEVSNLNIIASEDVSGKVTLRLIDVPWDQALDVILKTNGLDQVTEGNVIRIAPVDKLRQEREALKEAKRAAENLEDLAVQYVRISYARAEDVKPKVEAVLSERGSVTADERTNQLIIKDIQSGQKEALDVLKKLDLRTPQILLETQIVEGTRTILRDLGFQWNFSHIQSPATGNATGVNFPNTVNVGGGTSDGENTWAVNFPSAAVGPNAGSAITAILDSADGSKLIAARLSALEQEGKAKVVSKPQVATINNKEAKISSVTTIRVRVPNAGTTVATGAGASAAGGGALAFQEFKVGIELEVTPQASPDYYVLLDINAKSSTFSSRRETDEIPATVDREATSSILVKSGQTFALGGVYRIEDKDNLNGIPFLKDIPFLGTLFRRNAIEKIDEELLFFITPHIVKGSFDDKAM